MNYWLFKSEPDEYSIDNLKDENTVTWDGIRNYQSRNFLRDKAKKSDIVLFYHSSTKNKGIAGIAIITETNIVDQSQFDQKSPYFDPKSSIDNPRWVTVKIKYKKKFKRIITLDEIKKVKELESMTLLKQSRLSISPVHEEEFNIINSLT